MPHNILANDSMFYKHKTEKDAHSLAAKVILVKLGTEPAGDKEV